MTTDTQGRRDYGFLIGLLTGTFVGAGLAMWLAPRLRSELRQRLTDSASEVGNRASERYQQVSARVGDAVDDLTKKGQSVRDDVVDAVVHGAHEVARLAAAAKTDPVIDIKEQSAADRSSAARQSL